MDLKNASNLNYLKRNDTIQKNWHLLEIFAKKSRNISNKYWCKFNNHKLQTQQNCGNMLLSYCEYCS